MADPSLRNPLLIGIIGCGRLGSHLANCLLTFGEVNPEEMKISTRRPETLSRLAYVCLFVHTNKRPRSTCTACHYSRFPSIVNFFQASCKKKELDVCMITDPWQILVIFLSCVCYQVSYLPLLRR